MNAAAATLRAMDDSALARPAAPAALHGTEHEYLLEGHGPLATTGILLIHGLTGTPNEMRLLAKGLHRAGFTVLAVQAAGHCGTQEDLIATRWQDWVASARRGADRLMQLTGQPVVACGLSMGALLALALAIERPRQVAGVVALSTTFRYDGWSMPAYTRLAFLLPLFRALGIGRRSVFMEAPPYGIKDEALRERVVSQMHSGDSAAAGLPGNPWWSVIEPAGAFRPRAAQPGRRARTLPGDARPQRRHRRGRQRPGHRARRAPRPGGAWCCWTTATT